MVPVNVEIDHEQVRRLLTGPNGLVVQAVEDLARRVSNEAKERARFHGEGTLRNSIQAVVQVQGNQVIGRVGSALDYAIFVHEGTGLFGPKHHKIFPTGGKPLLTWLSKEAGHGGGKPRTSRRRRRKGSKPVEPNRVFARWTRGMAGTPFLTDALSAVSPWPVKITRR